MSKTVFTLNGKTRTKVGHKAKQLLRENTLPSVIYSKKLESIAIEVPLRDFVKVYKETGKNHIIELSIDKKNYNCLVHDLDVHPFRKEVRHVDFLAVDLNKKVTASVPVEYVGKSEAIKSLGAILNTHLSEIEISALPGKLPDKVEVDISVLANYDVSIHVKDLNLNCDIITDPEVLIANLSRPRGYQEDESTEAENPEVEDKEENSSENKTQ